MRTETITRTADRPTKHGNNYEMRTYHNGEYAGSIYAQKHGDLLQYAKKHSYKVSPQQFSEQVKAENRRSFKATGGNDHEDKGTYLEKRVAHFILRYWKDSGRISTKFPRCYFVDVWGMKGDIVSKCIEAQNKKAAAEKAAEGHPYKFSDTPRPYSEPAGTLWIKSIRRAVG